MADVHDSTQIAQGAGETASGGTAAPPDTEVSGGFSGPDTEIAGGLPNLDIGTVEVGPLGERLAFVGATAVLVAVGVLGILGVATAVPGNAVSGVFSVVALFGVAAAAPSLARRALVGILEGSR